jgi:TolA-binding protein
MTKSFPLLVGALAVATTGCLASKGDIRLLQDELRASRAAAARSDSVSRRRGDSLAAAIASLAAMQSRIDRQFSDALQQTDDRLSSLSSKVSSFEVTTRETLKSVDSDIARVEELSRQNLRGLTSARAAAEQALATSPVVAAPDSAAAGTTGAAAPTASSGVPGPATLIRDGNGLILQHSCRAARRNFEEVLSQYPASPEAPQAQYLIAESFVACADGGNQNSADSVYSLVTSRYPKSDYAAVALYKRASMQAEAGNATAARGLYQRIVCEYPKSTVFLQAQDKLGRQTRCR